MRRMCGMKNVRQKNSGEMNKIRIELPVVESREWEWHSLRIRYIFHSLNFLWSMENQRPKADTDREIITYLFERTGDLFIFFHKQRENGRQIIRSAKWCRGTQREEKRNENMAFDSIHLVRAIEIFVKLNSNKLNFSIC